MWTHRCENDGWTARANLGGKNAVRGSVSLRVSAHHAGVASRCLQCWASCFGDARQRESRGARPIKHRDRRTASAGTPQRQRQYQERSSNDHSALSEALCPAAPVRATAPRGHLAPPPTACMRGAHTTTGCAPPQRRRHVCKSPRALAGVWSTTHGRLDCSAAALAHSKAAFHAKGSL